MRKFNNFYIFDVNKKKGTDQQHYLDEWTQACAHNLICTNSEVYISIYATELTNILPNIHYLFAATTNNNSVKFAFPLNNYKGDPVVNRYYFMKSKPAEGI